MALGYRNRTDLADRLKFTMRTLSDIEKGVRDASPGSYAMLEYKLAWAPGSIDTILAGGEPKELVVKLRRDSPEHRYQSVTTDALFRASTRTGDRSPRRSLLVASRRPSPGGAPRPEHNAHKALFDRCAGCERKRDFVAVSS